MKSIILIGMVLGSATTVLTTWGDEGSQIQRPNDAIAAKEPWVKVDVSITPSERKIIQEYVQNGHKRGKGGKKAKSLPPGLAKKAARGGQLPPGWQKKCIRGEILPEEVYKECHPLPGDVVATLPAPPPGTILVAVSGKVVRLIEATREILDVFDIRL